MKLGGLDLPALPALALPRLPLAAFRRRIVFHGVFVLLALAVLLLALSLLAEEKQRSRARYEAGFRETLAALAAQLRHPAGQLALLNPGAAPAAAGAGGRVPQVLPFSAIDFDDPFKARLAVEMSGCALRWPNDDQLCVAIGQSAYAGGFVYLVAQLALPAALPRPRGSLDLQAVHRAQLSLASAGSTTQWVAPFEAAADAPVQRAGGGLRGRLTGFAGADGPLEAQARPDRDFRGWLWQDADCLAPAAGVGAPGVAGAPASAAAASASAATPPPDCLRRTLLSVRLPVPAWRDALFERRLAAWPPADLDRTRLRLQWWAPGGVLLFDSDRPGAAVPFSLQALQGRLAPGETLRIERQDPGAAAPAPVALLKGSEPEAQAASPWLTRLILRLPYDAITPGLRRGTERLQAEESVGTVGGRYRLVLTGDLQGVDRSLGATATRLSGFVGAMLGAIALAWLVIELGLVRRVAVLTQRAAALSLTMQDPQAERRLGELAVADLRGRDELGILAGTLAELLQRVKDSVRREQIRVEQERDMWHAVGHEIMSPLQSLMVLHGRPQDPSHRYVQRMQQAVRVLYGTASPSEAIEAAALQAGSVDLDQFLQQVAANAPFVGIEGVQYLPLGGPLPVRADEHALEDVVTHVLRNAARYRLPGTPITLALQAVDEVAEVRLHNRGPAIDPALLARIFEYGVSDPSLPAADAGAHRGQGLFVARTYMAKMGGTIEAVNADGGVCFVLRLARGRA